MASQTPKYVFGQALKRKMTEGSRNAQGAASRIKAQTDEESEMKRNDAHAAEAEAQERAVWSHKFVKNPLINTQDDPIGASKRRMPMRTPIDDMSLKCMKKKFPDWQRVLGAATNGDDDKLAEPVENPQLIESGFGHVTKSAMRKLQQLEVVAPLCKAGVTNRKLQQIIEESAPGQTTKRAHCARRCKASRSLI